jgi:hypothetical protein
LSIDNAAFTLRPSLQVASAQRAASATWRWSARRSMKVSPALDMSLNQPLKAIDMVNQFSHSMLAPPPSAMGPGTWLYGTARALMRRMLASNPTASMFSPWFQSCDRYSEGLAPWSASYPVLFVLGPTTRPRRKPPRRWWAS